MAAGRDRTYDSNLIRAAATVALALVAKLGWGLISR
jgi:hypothetical protein